MNNTLKFIIVDDDHFNNSICSLVLKRSFQNAEVIDFTSPEDGLEHIKNIIPETKPQILLLDINMPSMTGWEFLDEFEKLPSTVKQNYIVYIVSSSIDDRDMERARKDKNVKGYLVKPLKKDDIVRLFNNE